MFAGKSGDSLGVSLMTVYNAAGEFSMRFAGTSGSAEAYWASDDVLTFVGDKKEGNGQNTLIRVHSLEYVVNTNAGDSTIFNYSLIKSDPTTCKKTKITFWTDDDIPSSAVDPVKGRFDDR